MRLHLALKLLPVSVNNTILNNPLLFETRLAELSIEHPILQLTSLVHIIRTANRLRREIQTLSKVLKLIDGLDLKKNIVDWLIAVCTVSHIKTLTIDGITGNDLT